jgi:RNA polymerase sigma factor (sigma-70 family)
MATRHLGKVLPSFRRAVLLRDGGGLSDGQLLDCYLAHREETAFAALVRRHGPMVWGVCRRVLSRHHDAEDAFQATFLVLVRKAASVVPREKVANWLYGVAYKTALKARAAAARRDARERQVMTLPESPAAESDCWNDLRPLLDHELSRLPDLYRVPVLLCDLEGKTHREAARQLGCPEGTLAARLTRARALLAKRLVRHGLMLSGGSLALALSVKAASASVPPAVVSAAVQAASLFAAGPAAAGVISAPVLALTEGVLQAMLVNKLRTTVTALLLVGVLGAGVGAGGLIAQSYGPGQGNVRGGSKQAVSLAAAQNANQDEEQVKDADLEKIQRALEEQQRLLEEKEKELARLQDLLGATKAKQPKGEKLPRDGRTADLEDLERQLGQLGKKDFDWQSLKELWGRKADLKDLPQASEIKQRVIEELEAELARLRDPGKSKPKHADARSEDANETLKRLTEVLQRWAEGNRPIEPAEVKKVLADLHQEPRLRELKRLLESRQQILQEKDAELAKLKQKLAEMRGKSSPDVSASPSGTEPRQREAELEKLKLLLKEQENALRQKDEELKKLQDLLKKFPKKPKTPDDGD